jgi:hypothetical protein
MIDITIFAQQAADTGTTIKGTAAAVISLAWIIIAYAALPLVAKTFFGFLGTIAGAVNDRSRGGFDRLKKYRQGKTAQNFNDMKTGNRFKNREFTNPITGKRVSPGRRLNTITRGAATGTAGHFGIGQRGEQAQHQAIETAANEVAKSSQFAAISQYDDAVKAGTYDTEIEARTAMRKLKRASYQGDVDSGKISEAEADTYAARDAESGIQAYKAAGFKFGDRAVQYAAARSAVSTGTTLTDQNDMESMLARVSHGNQAQIGALSGFSNSETKKVGRFDMAPGTGNLINRVQQQAGVLPQGAKPVSAAQAQEEAWNSASLYQHANAKPQNIQAAINHYTTEMQSGDRGKMQKAAVFFEELKAIQPNASGAVSNKINAVLKDYTATVPPAASLPKRVDGTIDYSGVPDLARAKEHLLSPPGGAAVTTTINRRVVQKVTTPDTRSGAGPKDTVTTPETIIVSEPSTEYERDRINKAVSEAARTYRPMDPNDRDR